MLDVSHILDEKPLVASSGLVHPCHVERRKRTRAAFMRAGFRIAWSWSSGVATRVAEVQFPTAALAEAARPVVSISNPSWRSPAVPDRIAVASSIGDQRGLTT